VPLTGARAASRLRRSLLIMDPSLLMLSRDLPALDCCEAFNRRARRRVCSGAIGRHAGLFSPLKKMQANPSNDTIGPDSSRRDVALVRVMLCRLLPYERRDSVQPVDIAG
jgi:hypothetical protein